MTPTVALPLWLCPHEEYVVWIVNWYSECRCECKFWEVIALSQPLGFEKAFPEWLFSHHLEWYRSPRNQLSVKN